MKKIFYLYILAAALFTSCEDVVNVDLETAAPKLVIDASLDWTKGTDGSNQVIKLTTTSSYYSDTVPPATGATVYVTDDTGTVYNFVDSTNTGTYTCTDFDPAIGRSYTLTILYQNETYTGTETLYEVPDIVNITQINDGGFLGDETEVRFYFQDNGEEDNYYLTRFDSPTLPYPAYGASDDQFTQGNLDFSLFSDKDFTAGQTLGIKLYGISKRYKNYMDKLIEVSGGGGGGPFSTPPATVRGNMINRTNEANYPFGYFRVTQVDSKQYTIQ